MSTHGTSGLIMVYLLTLAALVAGLAQARAAGHAYLRAPLWAGGLLLIVAFLNWPLARALHGGIQALVGLVVALVVGFFGGHVLARQRSAREPEHRRGAFVSNDPLRVTGDRSAGRAITLAGVRVPLLDETKHFKILGTTGTGKSTAIREILDGALARGDRLVIVDPDGAYLKRYYDAERGDVILSPFNPGAHKWDLFGEIVKDFDIDELARALIPDAAGDDRIWAEYARTLFGALIRQMRESGDTRPTELARLLKKANDEELRMLLEDTPAARFFKEGSERMLGSIQGVLSAAMETYDYIKVQHGPALSVRKWVREGRSVSNGGRGGVLFLPFKAGEIAALRGLISAWMRLGIFEAMSGEEGDQWLWFFIDELDALGKIDGLKDALARLRKFGGRCVISFQAIAQVSAVQGKSDAETIVENCGNTLILRCSGSERGGTSEFASKLIGQREVIHTTMSTTRRSGEWRSSTSKTEQLRIEPAVLGSEIERLPDFVGYLKLASMPDWRLVKLRAPVERTASQAKQPPNFAATPPQASAPADAQTSGTSQATEPSAPKKRGRPKGSTKSAGRKAAASAQTAAGAADTKNPM